MTRLENIMVSLSEYFLQFNHVSHGIGPGLFLPGTFTPPERALQNGFGISGG